MLQLETATPGCEGGLDPNTRQFLLVVTCFILSLVLVVCVARLVLIYCKYKRQREEFHDQHAHYPNHRPSDVEEIGHPFSYLAESGFANCGFAEPPPRYDQLFKDEAPPPFYDEPTAENRIGLPEGTSETRPRNPAVQRSQSVQESVRPEVPSVNIRPMQRYDLQSLPGETPVTRQICIAGGLRASIGSSNGNLPDGAFGTSIPPVNLDMQDDNDDIRIRSATDASNYGSPAHK